MKIEITGATGFVGSHLVRHFSENGDEVIAYGRKKVPPAQLLKHAEYVQWDLKDQQVPVSQKSDVFIHAGSYVDFWGSYKDMFEINVMGTLRAMRMARHANHFIYISSASVYDSWKDKKNVNENESAEAQHANHYATTKALAEQVCVLLASQFESVTILRPHAIYGPGDRVLAARILKSFKKKNALVIGSGENLYSITHIGNLCYSLSLLLNSEKKGLNIYNVANSETISINAIYNLLIEALHLNVSVTHIPRQVAMPVASALEGVFKNLKIKHSPLLTPDIVRQLSQESTLSLQKIEVDCGYVSKYQARDGFKDLHTWLESLGGLDRYLSESIDPWDGISISY